MIDINKVEKYFINYGYEDIINNAKPFGAQFTSLNVWGNEVIWLDISNPERVIQKRYKLKNYYVDAKIKEGDNIETIKERLTDDLTKKNFEMFGGVTNFEKLLDLTCNQLAEWQWLRDDDGKIFHEKHKDGETVYTATLAKYAVVLDSNGNPIDPDIKEIRR